MFILPYYPRTRRWQRRVVTRGRYILYSLYMNNETKCIHHGDMWNFFFLYLQTGVIYCLISRTGRRPISCERGQGKIILPVQLTMGSTGNLTQLIPSLLKVMTVHTRNLLHPYVPITNNMPLHRSRGTCRLPVRVIGMGVHEVDVLVSITSSQYHYGAHTHAHTHTHRPCPFEHGATSADRGQTNFTKM